jgi:membrane-bound metal-dependent hydrolase YbcI (DUF457 family)
MWPWAHGAVGYLLYRLAGRQAGRPPDPMAVVVLGLATQLPDLIDKPLGWYLGVLPGGRSLAHSLLFAGLACAIAYSAARRYRRSRLAAVFALGYTSHLAGDAYAGVLSGRLEALSFLAYPFVPIPPEPPGFGLLSLIGNLRLDAFLAFELVVTLLAVGLWLSDGRPGLAVVAGWLPGVTADPPVE